MARKSAVNKIGIVKITQLGENRWRLRYTDPRTKEDVRHRVSGQTEAQILETAANISQNAFVVKGYRPGKPVKEEHGPGIEEAIRDTLNLTRMRDHVRRMAMARGLQFVLWLAKRYPGIRTWDQLKPVMVQTYLVEMERSGLAFDTIRLRMTPIRSTWAHVADNYPNVVRPMPRIRQAAPERKQEISCLEPGEVATLLEWLKKNAPDMHAMACLQGLCGLRMLEAVALRVQDVDLAAGTIEITDTGLHKPKTKDSYRIIPVCSEVLEALRAAIIRQKVKPTTGEIFTHSRGGPFNFNTITTHWTVTLRLAADKTNHPVYRQVPARKLRAAFATMAGRLETPERLLKAYIGHVPGDMFGQHYRKISLDELRTVSARIETWRELLKEDQPRQLFGNPEMAASAGD